MQKVLNKCTFVPLSHAVSKLDQHIEKMNGDSWELISVAVEAVGIEEFFICFWRKVVDDTKTS